MAWQHCQALLAVDPVPAPCLDISSRVALAMGQRKLANELAGRALHLDADNPLFLAQRAFCLLALRDYAEAEDAVAALAAVPCETAIEYDNLGNLYSELGNHDKAVDCFRQAIACKPEAAHHWFNLGLCLQAGGDLQEAEQAFDKAVELNPDEAEPWLHRSRLRKQTPASNHVAELKRVLARQVGKHWRQEMNLRYALAKELEDLGDYAPSFDQLQAGSSLRRRHMDHDPAADLAAMELIRKTYDAAYISAAGGSDSSEPIFVVGLPRTGTTLVERILGSHSAVYAAGELNNFAECLTAQVAPKRPKDRSDYIRCAAEVDSAALGRQYIHSTRPQTGRTERFVDKLPLNFLYCGLIKRALPNARIIHLQRDPMDACYAIYKTLFKQAYPFSYDLRELGEYYLAYRELMDHWQSLMPDSILQLEYEKLVANQESESRRLLDFCQLPWEDGCLEFYRNKAPSMTASLAQVRQPVYTSSIGMWRNYARQLAPLQTVLSRGGLEISTEAGVSP